MEESASKPVTAQPPTPPPQVSEAEEKLRREFVGLIFDLLNKANELSFEMATLECTQSSTCPVVSKCKDLLRTVKKVIEVQREVLEKARAEGRIPPQAYT